METPELIVIGGGVGGAAAALRAAQYEIPTAWVLGDRDTRKSSRAAYVRNIDNMIGVHPGVVQGKIADALRAEHPKAAQAVAGLHLHISTSDLVENVAARIRAEYARTVTFVEDRVMDLARAESGWRVDLKGGTGLEARYVILATGVTDRQPVIYKEKSGRDLSGIHWVYPYANQETLLYCIRCEGHLTRGRKVGVIGAGPAAAEVALMLRERYDPDVVLLTAGEEPSWSAEQAHLLELQDVRVVRGRLTDVHGGAKGAELKAFDVEGEGRVEMELALVAMGLYRVFNDLAHRAGATLVPDDAPLEERHVLVDAFAETSAENLYAIGDIARREGEPMMKQVYTAQEYAVRAVDSVDRRRRRAARGRMLANPA